MMQASQKSAIHRLIYQSRSTLADKPHMQIEAIQDVLLHARRHNIKCGVSGILLYNQLEYFQVLEGSSAAVELIFRSILRDRRHTDVVTLQRGPADGRIFHSWSMAYKELPYGAPWFDYSIHDLPTMLLSATVNTVPGLLAGQGRQLR